MEILKRESKHFVFNKKKENNSVTSFGRDISPLYTNLAKKYLTIRFASAL